MKEDPCIIRRRGNRLDGKGTMSRGLNPGGRITELSLFPKREPSLREKELGTGFSASYAEAEFGRVKTVLERSQNVGCASSSSMGWLNNNCKGYF